MLSPDGIAHLKLYSTLELKITMKESIFGQSAVALQNLWAVSLSLSEKTIWIRFKRSRHWLENSPKRSWITFKTKHHALICLKMRQALDLKKSYLPRLCGSKDFLTHHLWLSTCYLKHWALFRVRGLQSIKLSSMNTLPKLQPLKHHQPRKSSLTGSGNTKTWSCWTLFKL